MTNNEVKTALIADSISRKGDQYIVRWGFFYRHGRSASMMADRVRSTFPTASIIESGEVWKPFNGGASVASQSHWFVRFTFVQASAMDDLN